MELVRMPAWEFVMGSDPVKQKSAEPNEKPEHRVSLPGYYMSKYEVTNAQYRAFVNATGHAVPAHWVQGTIPVGEEQHPVVYVSWYDAQAFADWVRGESGRAFRLPTEAEWEKACRTAQGSLYPWGDSLPDSATANFGATMGDTTRVGTHSPQGDSTHGTADMAGNVAEWTNSLPRPYPYLVTDGRENESDPGPRIVRGGAYWNDAAHVRCASRSSVVPVVRNDSTGFRLALSSAP
jgi:formylglycine-generating enzyme required for sulfatase activity